MKKFKPSNLQRHMPMFLRFAPWILLITVFLLFQYFLFLNAKAVKKEEITAIHITKDRGASIIHSFEATLFASKGFTDEEIHNVLSEQANRTDIHFVALMDKAGTIINSNNIDIIGQNLMPLLSHAKALGQMNGVILDIKLEKGKKLKTFLVEKQLFVMHHFKEKHPPNRKAGEFPHRRYNPLNKEERTDLKNAFSPPSSSLKHSPFNHPSQNTFPHDHSQTDNCPDILTCFDAQNPQMFPHPTMWRPRRHFMEENPLYMLIAFDMKEIENAQKQDDAIGQIYTIGSLFLIILSIFSFFILRAYQRSYLLAKQSKDYILSLMHALPLGIIAIDHNKNIQTMNQEAEQLTHEKESNATQKNIFTLLPQLTASNLDNLQNKTITLHPHSAQTNSVEISTFPILDTQNPHNEKHGTGIILRDLKEIQTLQEEIHRQERLASVGRLAAGIAHEIRNPLGTIKGIARLFEEKALRAKEISQKTIEINCEKNIRTNTQENSQSIQETHDNEVKLASIMTQEINRVDKVISDLLELSKPNTITPKDTSIQELLEKAKNSVFSHAQGIQFIEKIEENCTHAFLDEDRMIQVLHNLFINAIQAMDNKQANKGTIEICIRKKFEQIEELEQFDLLSSPHDLKENTTSNIAHHMQKDMQNSILEMRIIDTGKGIAEEDIKNLFTPYYTNKAQGTGLGLVMVQKIIQAHNGTVRLESELDKGTSVIITLPQ